MPLIQSAVNGIKYIKISKEDCNLNNYNLPLSQLQILRLHYPNLNLYVNYNIINITDKGTYFLYEVQENPTSSFEDSVVLDYRVYTENINTFIINAGQDPKFIINYNTPLTNSLNYFNSGSGSFNLQDTPNTILNYTFSFTVNSNTNNNSGTISFIKSPFDLQEPNSGTPIKNFNFIAPSGSTSYVFSGTFTATNQDQYIFKASNDTNPFDVGNLQFIKINVRYNQIYFPQTNSCNNVIIEPYLDTMFYNSEFNPLLNNVNDQQKDTFFQIVDFKVGKDIPSNIQSIISGTAEMADVKQYNYISNAHILPRYKGSKTTSKLYNVFSKTLNSPIFDYTQDSSYGKTAAIDKKTSLIFLFNYAGGGYPQLENGGGFKLNNIINYTNNNKIDIFKINEDLYKNLIEKYLYDNTKFNQFQLNQLNSLQTKQEVLYPNVRIPGVSNYYLPQSSSLLYATCSFNINNNFILFNNVNFFGSQIGTSGFEEPLAGPVLINNTQANVVNNISSSLSNNTKRWFISLYESLDFTASGTLNQIQYPIEILSIQQIGSVYKYNLSNKFDLTNFNNYYIGSAGTIPNSLGALIWESPIESYDNLLCFGSSPSFSGTSKGYILTEYFKDSIKDNIKEILTKVDFIN